MSVLTIFIKRQHFADLAESEDNSAIDVIGAVVEDVVEEGSGGTADVVAADEAVLELAPLQVVVT